MTHIQDLQKNASDRIYQLAILIYTTREKLITQAMKEKGQQQQKEEDKLSESQKRVLDILYRRQFSSGEANPKVPSNEIAKETGISASHLSKILKYLEEKRYIKKIREGDERYVKIQLDDEAIEKAKTYRFELTTVMEKILSNFDEDDLSTINKAINLFTESLDKLNLQIQG